MTAMNQQWEWKLDPTYAYMSSENKLFKKIQCKRVSYYREITFSENIANTCQHPVDVTFNKGRPKIIYVYDHQSQNDESSLHTSSVRFGESTFDWRCVFGEWNTVDTSVEKEIIEKIKTGSLLAGLDGSVTDGKGAFSFGLFMPDSKPLLLHHGPVHGDSEQQNSTRSEMHGILGLILYLQHIATKYKLNGSYPPIKVFGDNMESLRVAKVGPSTALKHTFSSDADVAWELYHQVQHSLFTFQFQHVKSHQDDTTEYDLLSVDAKINVQCDKFVTQFFLDPIPESVPYLEKIPHYPSQKVSLANAFTRITNLF